MKLPNPTLRFCGLEQTGMVLKSSVFEEIKSCSPTKTSDVSEEHVAFISMVKE